MKQSQFDSAIRRVEDNADRIIATEFGNWPEAARRNALTEPLHEIWIEPDKLAAILSGNRRYRACLGIAEYSDRRLVVSDILSGVDLEEGVFPKIGVCSWKEMPGRGIWHPEMLHPEFVADIFNGLGDRIALVSHAWIVSGKKIPLYLFPVFNMHGWTEVRLIVRDKKTSIVSHQTHSGEKPILSRETFLTKKQFGRISGLVELCGDGIYEVALKDDGRSFEVYFIDINPHGL